MANVLDVANLIISKTGTIDVWKLQKLVYYCQAWSLVWDNQPMFSERIEAWSGGPACVELYQKYKGQHEVKDYDFTSGKIFTSDEIETVDAIIRDYGDKKNYELRMLTQMEDPWLEARGDVPFMHHCENEITHESMKLYYGNLYRKENEFD